MHLTIKWYKKTKIIFLDSPSRQDFNFYSPRVICPNAYLLLKWEIYISVCRFTAFTFLSLVIKYFIHNNNKLIFMYSPLSFIRFTNTSSHIRDSLHLDLFRWKYFPLYLQPKGINSIINWQGGIIFCIYYTFVCFVYVFH